MEAQPLSDRALLLDVAREGLPNGFRYASVAGMNRRVGTKHGGKYCLSWRDLGGMSVPRPNRSILNNGMGRLKDAEVVKFFRGYAGFLPSLILSGLVGRVL